MVALVFMGTITTGCSSDDDSKSLDKPASKTVTLTTTISRDGGGDTRTLTEDGVKTFAVGDQFAVVYTNTGSERVKAVSEPLAPADITNEGRSAQFTVTLRRRTTAPSVCRTALLPLFPASWTMPRARAQ